MSAGNGDRGPMTRELDLLWNQGVTPLRSAMSKMDEDFEKMRTDIKEDFKALAENMASVRRLTVTIIVTSIPAYVTAVIAYFALRK